MSTGWHRDAVCSFPLLFPIPNTSTTHSAAYPSSFALLPVQASQFPARFPFTLSVSTEAHLHESTPIGVRSSATMQQQTYTCECGDFFGTSHANYARHWNIFHTNDNQDVWHCGVIGCTVRHSSPAALARHVSQPSFACTPGSCSVIYVQYRFSHSKTGTHTEIASSCRWLRIKYKQTDSAATI